MSAISYNIITKDAPEQLKTCITSVYEALYEPGDECVVVDTGSTDENLGKLRDLLAKFEGARLITAPEMTTDMRPLAEKWIPQWAHLVPEKVMQSFASAREIARKASKNPIIFWIDTDDVLKDPSNGVLRETVNQMLNPDDPKINSVFLDYEYAFAEDGQCTTVLKRERFVFRDLFHWKGRCHETLIPNADAPLRPNGYFENLGAKIVHQRTNEDEEMLRTSDARNYLIQRREMEEDGAAVDTRTRFYFGNACRGLKLYYDAIKIYREFVQLSGSMDDRWAAMYYIGGMYLTPELNRPFDAMDAYLECAKINPFDPRGYFGVSRAYSYLQRWRECLFWYKTGAELPAPNGLHSYDPTQVHYHPQLLASRACCELKDYAKALDYAKMAAGWRQQSIASQLPENDMAVRMIKECQNLLAGADIAKGVASITRNIQNPGSANTLRVGRAICKELNGIPGDLEDAGITKVEPPDPRPTAPSLAIWTGKTGEKWDYRNAKTGIGGSEKMVIMLAKEIQARGVNVSVYANMDHAARGIDPETGVLWRHWAEFDETRPRDALVVWRAVEALARLKSPAKIRMLWNHDVQNPARYTDEIMAVVDIIQCQSEFHTKPFKDAGRQDILDKVWIARNAIGDIHPDAAKLDFSKKDPKLVCYLSSPDRGLLTAAKIVREAQKTDPDIKFICCYGVPPWVRKFHANAQHCHIPDVGRDCSVDLYERELHAVLDEIGAVVLGRVGWDKVNEVLQKSGVWLYPTRFDEISCMAAMEAQAHGCIPVTTRHGAISETVPMEWCYEISLNDLEAAADWVFEATKIPTNSEDWRNLMACGAQEKFAVAPLAEEWISRLGLGVSGGASSPAICNECANTIEHLRGNHRVPDGYYADVIDYLCDECQKKCQTTVPE